MNKSNYSASEITRMMKIFNDNDVKLEFQNFDDLYKSFDEIFPVVTEAYFRNYKKKNCHSIFFEHDVKNKKLITYIKCFRYFDLCFFDSKLVTFVKALTEAFIIGGVSEGTGNNENFSGIRQLNDDFGLCYDSNNILLGYYFTALCDLKKINEYQVETLSTNLGFVEMDIHKNMRQVATKFLMSGVGYTPSKNLIKLQYCVDSQLFYIDIIKEHFFRYQNFYTILDTIVKYEVDEINIQLEPHNPNYIGIEVFPPGNIEEVTEFLSELVSLRLMDEESKKYILNNKKTKSNMVSGYVVKFRWDHLDDYNIKWYNKHSLSEGA